MAVDAYKDFFVASTGAGGALVGLLFVAVSTRPDQRLSDESPERYAVAASAYTAFVNAFFISLGALIPHDDLGGITLTMSLLALLSIARLARPLFRAGLTRGQTARRLVWLIIGAAVYLVELVAAIRMQLSPGVHDGELHVLVYIIFAIYSIGIARAWALLGARGKGFFAWISPMQDDEEKTAGGAP